MNFSTQTKKAGFIQPPTSMSVPFLKGCFVTMKLFFLTMKLISTMKLIYFEKSFIVVFGFVTPAYS